MTDVKFVASVLKISHANLFYLMGNFHIRPLRSFSSAARPGPWGRPLGLRATTLILLVWLGGCAGIPPAEPAPKVPVAVNDPAAREVAELLEQPTIDPLTRYLERHGAARSALVDRVRAERDKRCTVIADSYAGRDKTAANQEKLDSGYRYSCPGVVQAFAEQVSRAPSSGAKPGTTTPGSTLSTPSRLPSPPAAPSRQDTAALEKCYLPFAIKNYREAREACRKPAESGDARAQYNLGVSARVLQLFPEAVQWTQRAAAQGLPEAQLHLGLLYHRGQGLPQNSAKALQQFEQAGAQGLAEAQFMAGSMYYQGDGMPRDFERALRWFSQAAEQGHGQAQLYLGRIYSQGEGLAADLVAGRKWLLAAAKQRVSEAQYRLGMMYAKEGDVGADDVQAYVWLSLAAAGGNSAAAAPRDKIARKLSGEQLANARQRARRAQEGMH